MGILAGTGTTDDEAVFVDIKTSWVIAGIGHGHDSVLSPGATQGDIVAAANIVEFNRITQENIDSFHFHGDPASYPVSAIPSHTERYPRRDNSAGPLPGPGKCRADDRAEGCNR